MEAAIVNFTEDFDWQHTPFDIGLGWMVDFDQPGDFTGRGALEVRSNSKAVEKLVGLYLDDDVPLQAGTVLMAGERAVGELTSAVRSPTLKRNIALGWVSAEHASVGQKLIAVWGHDSAKVVVVKRPFLDPERKLLRARP